MNHGSLFSGIGGFDLAAEWMGWENLFHCEWNEFGQKVLKHYWPNAISYGDITKTDFTIWRGRIDVLTGGFPCQPYSTAGKRLGKEDERHLWPEMLRAIREIAPRYVVGENVRGLISWNGGMVFDEVQADLEACGYEVLPFVLPACGVNAPHRRDRVWFVAHRADAGIEGLRREREDAVHGFEAPSKNSLRYGCVFGESEQSGTEDGQLRHIGTGDSFGVCSEGKGVASDTSHEQLQRGFISRSVRGERAIEGQGRQFSRPVCGQWEQFPTQSPIRLRDDGLSSKLLRFVVKELQDEIGNTSKENRIENLPEVWERVQKKEVWEKIGGLYSLEKPEVLLQTMQLYSVGWKQQEQLSPFGSKLCEPVLQHLRKHKEFRCSPQGQELQKQRSKQFGDALSFLPHEVALAAGRFEAAISKFEAWHRNESIKAAGNAVVPQLVFQMFRAIKEVDSLPIHSL